MKRFTANLGLFQLDRVAYSYEYANPELEPLSWYSELQSGVYSVRLTGFPTKISEAEQYFLRKGGKVILND